MLVLKEEIKRVLNHIDFVRRYEELSREYAASVIPYDERLLDVNINDVLDVISDFGYKASYDKREKFFKVKCLTNQSMDLHFNLHLILKGGVVDIIWDVEHSGVVELGPSLGYLPILIDKENNPITMPGILSYRELKEILAKVFELFQEFQNLLILEYSS